jgi:hypothetical protein
MLPELSFPVHEAIMIMKKPSRQSNLKLELELQRARELFAQNRHEARQLLIHARAIAKTTRKRLSRHMTLPGEVFKIDHFRRSQSSYSLPRNDRKRAQSTRTSRHLAYLRSQAG